MTVYIGAEHIISPLGNSAEENFTNACEGKTGIKIVSKGNFNDIKLIEGEYVANPPFDNNIMEKKIIDEDEWIGILFLYITIIIIIIIYYYY